MRLLSIQVKHFFGIKAADVKFYADGNAESEDQCNSDRFVLLVGANGSGKSSLMKALQFFTENYPSNSNQQHSPKEKQPGKTYRSKPPKRMDTSTLISLQHLACRAVGESSEGVIELSFGLSDNEQDGLYNWRLLGLLNHTLSALKSAKRTIITENKGRTWNLQILKDVDTLNKFIMGVRKHHGARVLPKDRVDGVDYWESTSAHLSQASSADEEEDMKMEEMEEVSSSSSGDEESTSSEVKTAQQLAADEQTTWICLWAELERKLRELHDKFKKERESPFARLILRLQTVESDPTLAQYQYPLFHSANGYRIASDQPSGSDHEKRLDMFKSSFTALAKREFRVVSDVVYGSQLSTDLSANAKDHFFRAFVIANAPSRILQRHLAEFYHKLSTEDISNDDFFYKCPHKRQREFTLRDDFVFQRYHRINWETQVIVQPTSAAKNAYSEKGIKFAPEDKQSKKFYDGTSKSETRKSCTYGQGCHKLRCWVTRCAADPLLVPLKRSMMFPSVKVRVQQFVEDTVKLAFPGELFPEGFKLPSWGGRGLRFMSQALLRSSVAFLNQDRSRRPLRGNLTVERCPLPGLFDFPTAMSILIKKQHAYKGDRRSSPRAIISKAMARTVGISISISSHVNDGQAILMLTPVGSKNHQDDWEEDESGQKVPLDQGSGGHKEAFTVLVAAITTGYGTLFIDEPGHNIHPGAQMSLLQELQRCVDHAKSPRSLLLITHSERFLSKKTIENCYVASQTGHGCIVDKLETVAACQLQVNWREQLTLPPLSQLLFTQRAVLVEGPADFRILTLLQRLVFENDEKHIHDVIFLNGSTKPWLLNLSTHVCRDDLRLMIDFDKIVGALSKGSQEIKNGLPVEVKAKGNDILELVRAFNGNNEAELEPLHQAIKAFGHHARVFEQEADHEQRQRFAEASHRLRSAIWTASRGRVFVLERDLEEEFLRHNSILSLLCSILNNPELSSAKYYVPCDAEHAAILEAVAQLQSHLVYNFKQTKTGPKQKFKSHGEAMIKNLESKKCSGCEDVLGCIKDVAWMDTIKGIMSKKADVSYAMLSRAFSKIKTSKCFGGTENASLIDNILKAFREIYPNEIKLDATGEDGMDERATIEHEVSTILERLKEKLNKPGDSFVSQHEYNHKFNDIKNCAQNWENSIFEEVTFVPVRVSQARSPIFKYLHDNPGWKNITHESLKSLCNKLVELSKNEANKKNESAGNQTLPMDICGFVRSLGPEDGNFKFLQTAASDIVN